jgi:hypothetical protein
MIMWRLVSRMFLCSVLSTTLTGVGLAAETGNLRAGAARVDITQEPDQFPFVSRPPLLAFVGVHDPVFARALFLDDGKTQAAIVVVDVVVIPKPEEFHRTVAEAAGIPEANLLLVASHTQSVLLLNYHGGLPYNLGEPDANQLREIGRLRKGASEAVWKARSQLQPARVAFGRGEALLNTSTDRNGASDKSLDVLRIDGTDGARIALLADYGVPSSVMIHVASRDGGSEVSGDLFGVAAQVIEKQSPNAPVVLFVPAADGTQGPLLRAATPGGHVPGPNKPAARWEMLDAMAHSLASSTVAVMSAMPPGDGKVRLSAAAKTVRCPGQTLTFNAKTSEVTVKDAPPVDIPLNVIRINDIVLAGVGGNVAPEIGKKFKDGSPLPNSTLIGNTSGSVGYILTDANYEHPGHNLAGDPLKAGCAEKAIQQGLTEMIRGTE